MQYRSRGIACVAACAIIGLFSTATTAGAQDASAKPSPAELQSAAVKANTELVNGLAKELGSTPEQAAGVAGLLFSLTKSFVKPEDFAAVSKTVQGMDALLAATPEGVVATSGGSKPPSVATPGFASSSPASTTGSMTADGVASAWAGLSKLGVKPEMLLKAVPFLSGYLKKYGGTGLSSLLDGVFKGMGKAGK